MNKHLPLRKLSRREVKFNSKPWITKALRKSINHNNTLYGHFIRTKSTNSHHKYKTYRNKLTGLLRLSKKLYYQSYFKANQTNIKNVWKGIRQLISLKTKDSLKPNKLIKDNQEITDPKLIANEFNNYFATIGPWLASEIPSCGTRTHEAYLDNPHSSSFFLSPVYPFLTYGSIAWGNTYATTLKPVVVLQKKAVRIITFSNRDAHSNPLFSKLGLIKLMDLVTIHTALFMFQYHHNLG